MTTRSSRTDDRIIVAGAWALLVLAVLVTAYCIVVLAASGPAPMGTPPLPVQP
jgi:hypothetical protein